MLKKIFKDQKKFPKSSKKLFKTFKMFFKQKINLSKSEKIPEAQERFFKTR